MGGKRVNLVSQAGRCSFTSFGAQLRSRLAHQVGGGLMIPHSSLGGALSPSPNTILGIRVSINPEIGIGDG